ncbi:MAG: crotonase/enoyl-CoA hydratase family protein [Caldimonas sp.]
MNVVASSLVPSALSRRYRYVRLEWNPEFSMLTFRMGVRPIQCYSLAMIAELQQVLNDISSNPGLVRHFVMASDVEGVFNFGGDLSLFVLLVRARDLESLRLYARRCIDLVWWWENAAQLGVHTTALVQGDALGGGLEAALLNHTVIFERSAQAGYPEVLFNLFPGMGGWNLTIRKGGYAVANDMVLSGQVYTADQLYRRGLVDLVVDDGQGPAALEQFVRVMEPRFRGTMAALQARRLASPITYDSLQAIVDHWAVTALSLSNRDMRLMERLARAQVRKVGGADEGAVEEIKRMELDTAWGFERTGLSEWATLE